MTDAILVLKKVIAAYNMFLIILGTFGNILTCIICLRKRLRQINTFKFFSFIAVIDMIGLYEWNLRQFVLYFMNVDLSFEFLLYCDISSFFQYVAFETSAWFLVIKKNINNNLLSHNQMICGLGFYWLGPPVDHQVSQME